MIRLIVPSFSEDLLERFFWSLHTNDLDSVGAVIVGDNGLPEHMRRRWPEAQYVNIPQPFIYAQAINRCAAAAGQDDLLILEDDMLMLTPHWRSTLERFMERWPADYGVVQIATTADPEVKRDEIRESLTTVGLGVSLIPRRVWNAVGTMDERYVGYGYEDTDYCVRLLHAGYRIGVTGAVLVEHRGGQIGYTRRLGSYEAVLEQCRVNRDLFYKKWGIPAPADGEIRFEPAPPHLTRATCGCRP